MSAQFIDEFVLNKVNEDESFGVDLRDSDPFVFRFDGVNCIFANSIEEKLSEVEILNKVKDIFSNASEEQIKSDFKDFKSYLQEQNLIK